MNAIRTLGSSVGALVLSLSLASAARAAPAPDAERVKRGAEVYGRNCVSCHGVNGDGRGPSAEWVDPRPRNFTSGTYKFRSTGASELPTDADLRRTLVRGLNHTTMPHWRGLTDRELADVAQYLKTLSPRFAQEDQGKSIEVPPRPPFTPTLVAKGKEVWAKVQCASCHGDGGKGDGSSAMTLKDEWGYPILPRDFTSGPLKVGSAPEDLYLAFMAGLTGSPMPSFAETLSPDEAWALVSYVLSLRKD
jgi:cytochrome c oxidase cbb3-type subunit I/II